MRDGTSVPRAASQPSDGNIVSIPQVADYIIDTNAARLTPDQNLGFEEGWRAGPSTQTAPNPNLSRGPLSGGRPDTFPASGWPKPMQRRTGTLCISSAPRVLEGLVRGVELPEFLECSQDIVAADQADQAAFGHDRKTSISAFQE